MERNITRERRTSLEQHRITWRIRFSEGVVTLTAKGRRTGASAPEFEWNIPTELYESLPLEGLPSVRKPVTIGLVEMALFGGN